MRRIQNKAVQVLLLLLPLAAIAAGAVAGSLLLTAIACVTMFVPIGVCSLCHRYENQWTFFIVFLCSVEACVFYLPKVSKSVAWLELPTIQHYSYTALICMVAFCLLELVFGLIARIFWPRQYRFEAPEPEEN